MLKVLRGYTVLRDSMVFYVIQPRTPLDIVGPERLLRNYVERMLLPSLK